MKGLRVTVLNTFDSRLKNIMSEAVKIQDQKQKAGILKPAKQYISVVKDLRKTKLKLQDKMFPHLKIGILQLEDTLALILYGFDSPQAKKASEALKNEHERLHKEEHRKSLEDK